jgi:hypothetical protein
MQEAAKGVVIPVEAKLPPKRHRVIVVCKKFRCLGYIDEDGVWRDAAHSKELNDVIGWVEVSA